MRQNDEARKRLKGKQAAIEAQERECGRWARLHELIGSADGTKFRNFAQGLTFEMMIGHANRQLRKMSDRYLLVLDETEPLELDVVDNYQAGATRSTKNLSGGESFIVSLALALGLSHMSSRNVRVDSLFLDEGFGTLDDEALDMALETLAGLRQDGKLIGVISHVLALKERIATRSGDPSPAAKPDRRPRCQASRDAASSSDGVVPGRMLGLRSHFAWGRSRPGRRWARRAHRLARATQPRPLRLRYAPSRHDDHADENPTTTLPKRVRQQRSQSMFAPCRLRGCLAANADGATSSMSEACHRANRVEHTSRRRDRSGGRWNVNCMAAMRTARVPAHHPQLQGTRGGQ